MNKLTNILYLTFLILFLLGCEDKAKNEDMFSKGKKVSSQKDFILKTTHGEEISILVKEPHKIQMKTPKFANKVILLDFWATWCPPCIKEMPHLDAISKKYKDDLVLIGVLSEADKPPIELNKFLRRHKVTYPITTTDENNENLELLRVLTNLRTLPFKILYDKNGTYLNHYYGAIPEEMLELDIQQAINQ